MKDRIKNAIDQFFAADDKLQKELLMKLYDPKKKCNKRIIVKMNYANANANANEI